MPGTAVAEISGVEKAAVLMVSLGTLTSAEVFKRLDQDEIKKLSAGIIALRSVDPGTKATVLEEFAKARAVAARGTVGVRNFAAELFDDDGDELVRDFDQIKPDSTAPAEIPMHCAFEDIAKLDDASVKAMLEAVDRQTLCQALKAAADDVKNAILRNLTKSEAGKLKNEIEQMGAVRLRDITDSQERIAMLFRLHAAEVADYAEARS